jgi:2,3-bisphosphoglycerate-independent phosphoglycerate mutase
LGGALLITADHGNVEEMINLATNEIDKEHSTNPVPLWIVADEYTFSREQAGQVATEPGGILADVAPTVLELLEISQPAEMTGASLLHMMSGCPLPK